MDKMMVSEKVMEMKKKMTEGKKKEMVVKMAIEMAKKKGGK